MKAFVQFGEEADKLPDLPVAHDMGSDLGDDNAVAALLAGSVDERDLEYVSLEDYLTVPSAESDDVDTILGNPINLPTHMRCAAHNLVASKDADSALQRAVFKGPFRVAMAKAHASGTCRVVALWQQTASTLRWGGGWLYPTRRGGTLPMTLWWSQHHPGD